MESRIGWLVGAIKGMTCGATKRRLSEGLAAVEQGRQLSPSTRPGSIRQ